MAFAKELIETLHALPHIQRVYFNEEGQWFFHNRSKQNLATFTREEILSEPDIEEEQVKDIGQAKKRGRSKFN